ncbi:MAG: hypothetical protein ACRD0A_09655 [Acidimicrobiales bacterium]
MSIPRPPDPVRLVYAAPAITAGEDWRERSLWSWVILARHDGLEVERTDTGGPGFTATWCGNVRIDGLLYRIHRAPRLRIQTLDAYGHPSWLLHAATYAEPVTTGVELLDPRQDTDTTLPDLPSTVNPRRPGSDRLVPPSMPDIGR